MKKLAFIFFSLLASLFLFFSCVTRQHNEINETYSQPLNEPLFTWKIRKNIEINEIGTYSQPLIEQLPLKIGVYYGNDFSTFETTKKIGPDQFGGLIIANIKMGKANIALFDYILPHVFRKVTLVQHFSENPEDMKNIDLIIKPTIHKYSYNIPYNISPFECSIHITYEISFYSQDGELIKPWLIEGSGSNVASSSKMSNSDFIELLTQTAMRQVAAKFMTDFCNQEDIKNLFYKQCNQ